MRRAAVFVFGLALVVAGVGLWSPPAALVVAGVLMAGSAIAAAYVVGSGS